MLNQLQHWKQYGLAIATVVIALLFMLALDPILYFTRTSYLLFFGAIILSAFYGEQGGNIPAIALTAYAKEEDHHYALNQGFQKHIAKPVEPERLVIAVAELIVK